MPSDAFMAKQCRAYSSLKGSIFFETQGKTTSGAGGGGWVGTLMGSCKAARMFQTTLHVWHRCMLSLLAMRSVGEGHLNISL